MDPQPTLSERLIERRLLSGEELDRVLKLQQEHQAPLSRLVVELGFLSEEDLLPVLRDHFALPVMSLKDVPPAPLPIEPSTIESKIRSIDHLPGVAKWIFEK